MSAITEQIDLSEGDLVLTFNKTIDLMRQVREMIANVAPDRYAGLVAHVPFVDIVTTMLDTSIPLTTLEYDEWGNPNEVDAYKYMLSYSPYDNVKPQAYPAMFVTTTE